MYVGKRITTRERHQNLTGMCYVINRNTCIFLSHRVRPAFFLGWHDIMERRKEVFVYVCFILSSSFVTIWKGTTLVFAQYIHIVLEPRGCRERGSKTLERSCFRAFSAYRLHRVFLNHEVVSYCTYRLEENTEFYTKRTNTFVQRTCVWGGA